MGSLVFSGLLNASMFQVPPAHGRLAARIRAKPSYLMLLTSGVKQPCVFRSTKKRLMASTASGLSQDSFTETRRRGEPVLTYLVVHHHAEHVWIGWPAIAIGKGDGLRRRLGAVVHSAANSSRCGHGPAVSPQRAACCSRRRR